VTTTIAELMAALDPTSVLIGLAIALVNSWLVRIGAIIWIRRSYLRWTPKQRRDVRKLIRALKGRRHL